jgi:mannosyltransferase
VSHTTAPDAATVWMTLQTLIVGPAAAVALPLMVMVSMVLIAGSILDRRVRALVAACVITPPAVLLILSYGLRPAWHIRSLVFATPLIALALAAAVGAIADRLRALPRHGSTVTVLVLALLSIGFAIQAGQHVDRVRKTEDYPGLVAFLANRHQSGDAVLITDKVLFWGVARLYLGQDWGSPLRIQAGDLPERWAAIRDRLGPLWWRRLGLEAEGHVASKGHRQLLVGWDALPDAARSNRVWVIQPPPANTAPLSRLGLTAVEHHNFDGLLMTLWKH